MPDTRQLIGLFESLARRDLVSMEECALKIADQEERVGHTQAARQLRGALNGIGRNGHAAADGQSGSVPGGSEFLLAKALVRIPEGRPLTDVVLSGTARAVLNEVVAEWHAVKSLRAAGITRRSRLLFHGPPGCGKTMTALAIARELHLPAYLVRFNALIGSFLGQTALHLREVFHFASRTACVLLLDEVDVLGKHRGSQMDVGELDRIVVGLMQELELTAARGLIVAASNLASHLDKALWRRFDLHLEFKAPTKAALNSFLKQTTARHGIPVTKSLRSLVAKLRDYSAVERLVLDQARRRILSSSPATHEH